MAEASENQVLRWREGNGWLVLSGGVHSLSDVRALTLSRIFVDGGVAYIGFDDDDYDDLIDDMNELGAPTGYLVNVMTEDDETIKEQLNDASLIVIPDKYGPEQLKSTLKGAGLDGIEAAYARGTIILAEGTSAMLFGEKMMVAQDVATDGLAWVEKTFVMPGVATIAESDQARTLLAAHVAEVAVGLGVGSALALGPLGEVETWGNGEVTIALGGGSLSDDK